MKNNYSVEFDYRGLDVSAKINIYTPAVLTLRNGDPGYPAEGGDCESFTWEVGDLDEVLVWLELSEQEDRLARITYRMSGRLPVSLFRKINHDWAADICENAEDVFWNESGGPDES